MPSSYQQAYNQVGGNNITAFNNREMNQYINDESDEFGQYGQPVYAGQNRFGEHGQVSAFAGGANLQFNQGADPYAQLGLQQAYQDSYEDDGYGDLDQYPMDAYQNQAYDPYGQPGLVASKPDPYASSGVVKGPKVMTQNQQQVLQQ